MNWQKIIQIIPTSGWAAECHVDCCGFINRSVVCFALVEDAQGNTEIRGVYKWGKDTCFCEDDPDFIKYLREGENR